MVGFISFVGIGLLCWLFDTLVYLGNHGTSTYMLEMVFLIQLFWPSNISTFLSILLLLAIKSYVVLGFLFFPMLFWVIITFLIWLLRIVCLISPWMICVGIAVIVGIYHQLLLYVLLMASA